MERKQVRNKKLKLKISRQRREITRPSEGLMLVRWTSSRWADWETSGSDDTHTICSHTSDRVLHCRREQSRVTALALL